MAGFTHSHIKAVIIKHGYTSDWVNILNSASENAVSRSSVSAEVCDYSEYEVCAESCCHSVLLYLRISQHVQ